MEIREVAEQLSLEPIKAITAAAASEPWGLQPIGNGWRVLDGSKRQVRIADVHPVRGGKGNADFVANARTFVPLLVAEVERLRREIADWQAGRLELLTLIEQSAGREAAVREGLEAIVVDADLLVVLTSKAKSSMTGPLATRVLAAIRAALTTHRSAGGKMIEAAVKLEPRNPEAGEDYGVIVYFLAEDWRRFTDAVAAMQGGVDDALTKIDRGEVDDHGDVGAAPISGLGYGFDGVDVAMLELHGRVE